MNKNNNWAIQISSNLILSNSTWNKLQFACIWWFQHNITQRSHAPEIEAISVYLPVTRRFRSLVQRTPQGVIKQRNVSLCTPSALSHTALWLLLASAINLSTSRVVYLRHHKRQSDFEGSGTKAKGYKQSKSNLLIQFHTDLKPGFYVNLSRRRYRATKVAKGYFKFEPFLHQNLKELFRNFKNCLGFLL